MAKVTTVYFEDLTVGDILNYMGLSFCDAKFRYLKFGKNHRAVLREMWRKEYTHYAALRDQLGVDEDKPGLAQVAKHMAQYFDETEEQILQWLAEHIPDDWYKYTDFTKEQEEAEFSKMLNHIFNHIEERFKDHPLWGLKLAHKKKGK